MKADVERRLSCKLSDRMGGGRRSRRERSETSAGEGDLVNASAVLREGIHAPETKRSASGEIVVRESP